MPAYYTYLISSLPLLYFDAKPRFSFARFLEICAELLSEEDADILKTICVLGEYSSEASHPALKKWLVFDTALRNELIKIRAARKKVDPAKYLRQADYAEPAIARIAINAHKAPSLLESERLLDGERWRFLDALEFGHYFDLDFLIIYGLKLLILERWQRIYSADSARVLEETVA